MFSLSPAGWYVVLFMMKFRSITIDGPLHCCLQTIINYTLWWAGGKKVSVTKGPLVKIFSSISINCQLQISKLNLIRDRFWHWLCLLFCQMFDTFSVQAPRPWRSPRRRWWAWARRPPSQRWPASPASSSASSPASSSPASAAPTSHPPQSPRQMYL